MKIFLDSANEQAIAQWAKSGVLDGVTTNPTLLSRESKNPKADILTICSLLPHGVVNVEVVETDPDAIYNQAHKIYDLADNIVVKIPCHKHYYPIIKRLVNEGVRLNITLVFSLVQGLMMSKLGVTYISPFVGRLDDNGGDGIELVKQLRAMMVRYGFTTQILAASIRNMSHFENVIVAGADIVTLPVSLLEASVKYSLTDQGIEQFVHDWKKLNITQFP